MPLQPAFALRQRLVLPLTICTVSVRSPRFSMKAGTYLERFCCIQQHLRQHQTDQHIPLGPLLSVEHNMDGKVYPLLTQPQIFLIWLIFQVLEQT